MVVDKDSISRPEVSHPGSDLDHFASRLVAKDQGRFLLHIPAHHLARTDATRTGSDQRFARPDLRDRLFLKADIGHVVQPRDFH